MDTDTACARQQVMLSAKHRGDTKLKKKDRARRRQRQKSRRKSWALFTPRTHHPQLEHRCWDKDNLRVDPVCKSWLYPGWRWTIQASWSLAQRCEYFVGRLEQSEWRSWSLTRRKGAPGAWSAFLPLGTRRMGPPDTGPRAPESHWAGAPLPLWVSHTACLQLGGSSDLSRPQNTNKSSTPTRTHWCNCGHCASSARGDDFSLERTTWSLWASATASDQHTSRGTPLSEKKTSRSALQSSHLRDSHQLRYWSPPTYRRGETVTNASPHGCPHSPFSSIFYPVLQEKRTRQLMTSPWQPTGSIPFYSLILIDLWSPFLAWHKTAHINMTELFLLSSIYKFKNLPLAWYCN